MALFLFIQFLLYLLDVSAETCFVHNCDHNFCNDNICTKCDTSYYLASNNNCSRCFMSCRECNGEQCYTCANAQCDACIDNCTCSSNTVYCSSCPEGYYNDGSKCVTYCATGRYLDKSGGCKICPSRCFNCTDFRNCKSCQRKYYWGNSCQYDCTGCWYTCDKDKGCIGNCSSNYFKSYDASKRGNVCLRCPKGCITCNNSTLCKVCISGHWGSYCQYVCSGCNSDCFQHQGCIAGCDIGYYQRIVDDGILCDKCSDNCSICQDNTSCKECSNGYFLSARLDCEPCPDTCKDKICNRPDGLCTTGCNGSWFNIHCNESCPLNCQHCDQFCSSCKIGLYSNMCEQNCSVFCQNEDGLQICSRDNGICLHGCKPGYWGQFCDLLCETGCQSDLCNQTLGLCSNGCKDNFFGTRCERQCSHNCMHGPQTSRRCDAFNGNCLNGCNIGWYGFNCSAKCNTSCKEMICYQNDGLCKLGNEDGFTGARRTTGIPIEDIESNSNKTVIVALSIVTGIAVLVASFSIAVNIVFLKQRGFKLMSRIRKSDLKQAQERGELRLEDSQYQDLHRSNSTDEAYSAIANDYENYL